MFQDRILVMNEKKNPQKTKQETSLYWMQSVHEATRTLAYISTLSYFAIFEVWTLTKTDAEYSEIDNSIFS